MASKITKTVPGFTNLKRETSGGSGRAAGLILEDKDGNAWGLWFDSTGDLRTAEVSVIEASNFNPESSGGVVGSQS